ncbi:MAG: histidinol-phosphate transaminase [Sedimentisphaerales bacterium]|nr:histidinol-phosphate transaminase [Sedimentisphaerales bacterium]
MGYFRENIERLQGYVPGYQPGDADVVKINTNENPYPPSPKVLEAIRGFSPEFLRKYPQPLADSFREAACKVLGVGSGNIICTNGGDDLLTICFRAFCDEGRTVAYPIETYSLYEVLAELQNCKAVEIPFGNDNWIDDLVKAKSALTIICNPNAPTSTRVETDVIGELADKLSGVLLIDEAYVDFAEDNCLRLVEKYDNVIILRSMSKGYSLAGLRFGFGIANAELIAGLMKVKDSYNVDAIAIAAATAAIKDQKYFKSNVAKVKSERERLKTELEKLGLEVGKSETNFLLAKYSESGTLYEKLAERGIYVRFWNTSSLSDKLRITVGTKEDNDKLVTTLKEILS